MWNAATAAKGKLRAHELEDGIILITVHSFLHVIPARWLSILGVQDWLWPRPHAPQFTLEVVWVSSKSLHASWEFLFPVLWWDPRPLKVQLLFNVLLLTLFKEHGVLVAEEWQKAQYWFCRINESLRWWLYYGFCNYWYLATVERGQRVCPLEWVKPMWKFAGITHKRELTVKTQNTHWTVRHSFRAAFSSRHLNTMKNPDSLQQWLKAGERQKMADKKKKNRNRERGSY